MRCREQATTALAEPKRKPLNHQPRYFTLGA